MIVADNRLADYRPENADHANGRITSATAKGLPRSREPAKVAMSKPSLFSSVLLGRSMRTAFPLLLLLSATVARGAEPHDPKPFWNEAFEPISPSAAGAQLVLLVITNDDPYAAERAAGSRSDRETNGDADPQDEEPPARSHENSVWCGPVVAKAVARILTGRPDLEERLRPQALAAGLPRELSGGQPPRIPSQAIVLLCDGYYRLLAFCVGVPDSDQLLTLIEDGEEVQRSMTLQSEWQHRHLVRLLADRNRPGLSRMWRNVLDDLLKSLDGEAEETEATRETQLVPGTIHRLAESLRSAYSVDVRLRFGLNDPVAGQRLLILEQHPDVREPWCEVMTPFLAAINITDHWRELAESVWGIPPIIRIDDADHEFETLNQWITEQLPSSPVLLMVEPPHRMRSLPWPPNSAEKEGRAWQQLHEQATQLPVRSIHPQDLAFLIRKRSLRPVDVYRPTLARYVMLRDGDSTPLAIHESDPPGRFATLLQRIKTNP
jgi:hypothetical protein